MTFQNPINKRAHDRFRISVAVVVQSAPGSEFLEGKALTCSTRDLSLAGMSLYTDSGFPPDTRLTLILALGEPARTFNLLGKVIWSAPDKDNGQGYQVGINLIKLPGDEMEWQNAVLQMLVG